MQVSYLSETMTHKQEVILKLQVQYTCTTMRKIISYAEWYHIGIDYHSRQLTVKQSINSKKLPNTKTPQKYNKRITQIPIGLLSQLLWWVRVSHQLCTKKAAQFLDMCIPSGQSGDLTDSMRSHDYILQHVLNLLNVASAKYFDRSDIWP